MKIIKLSWVQDYSRDKKNKKKYKFVFNSVENILGNVFSIDYTYYSSVCHVFSHGRRTRFRNLRRTCRRHAEYELIRTPQRRVDTGRNIVILFTGSSKVCNVINLNYDIFAKCKLSITAVVR